MRVEVINTGSELLLGFVTNTHLPFLSKQLLALGLRIERQTTVPDGFQIREALEESLSRCDILLITGGLGPTADDITRDLVAEALRVPLLENEKVVQTIQDRCRRLGYTFHEQMRSQAMVPEGGFVLPNDFGSAPGLYIPPAECSDRKAPHIFLLPGPPRELQPMFMKSVLPRLFELQKGKEIHDCRIYQSIGLGESEVAVRIGSRLEQIEGLEVGYCARPSEVDLRIIGPATLLDQVEPEIYETLGSNLLTKNGELLEELVVQYLFQNKLTISTAESCTGGLLANRLTNVSSSSQVFLRGWVTYSNQAKAKDLDVDEHLLKQHGAVSEQVAKAMAQGALENAETDFALATTGIAGPGGGSEEKPVGTVFIALAQKGKKTRVWKQFYPIDRLTFKQVVTQFALDQVRRELLSQFKPS